MAKRRLVVGLVAVIAAVIFWRAWSSKYDGPNTLPGYLEGETLFMSAPISGRLEQVLVTRGQVIDAGAPLFAMDSLVLAAQRSQAQAQLQHAEAQVAMARAKAQKAKASAMAAVALADKADSDLNRYLGVQRVDREAVSLAQVDTAHSSAANARAQQEAAQSEASAEGIEVMAAEKEVAQYQAALADVQARFEQLSPRAPSPGRVQDVFYQTGEWAAANQPVVSILPSDKLKIRFFVPEIDVARYRPGDVVGFACDGCAKGLSAKVIYISPQAEFTPPVIYSRKSRERLVFLVEAKPTDPSRLSPGLPIEVTPPSAQAHSSP